MANTYFIWCFLGGILLLSEEVGAGKRAKNQVSLVPPAPSGTLLQSKDFQEVGCVPRKGVANLNYTFINKAAAWYIPMANKYFYYHWAEALINRSIAQSEMNKLCMKWLFMAPTRPRGDYNVIVGGYKSAVTQLCKDTGFETQTCEAPKHAPDYHKGADNVGTIVGTDNKSWILMVRCNKKQFRDWAVFVTDPKHLESNLFRNMASIVKNLGFDLKMAESVKYDSCTL